MQNVYSEDLNWSNIYHLYSRFACTACITRETQPGSLLQHVKKYHSSQLMLYTEAQKVASDTRVQKFMMVRGLDVEFEHTGPEVHVTGGAKVQKITEYIRVSAFCLFSTQTARSSFWNFTSSKGLCVDFDHNSF